MSVNHCKGKLTRSALRCLKSGAEVTLPEQQLQAGAMTCCTLHRNLKAQTRLQHILHVFRRVQLDNGVACYRFQRLCSLLKNTATEHVHHAFIWYQYQNRLIGIGMVGVVVSGVPLLVPHPPLLECLR